MRWERFFEDLEDQLDSEWEAERAALDTEAERLRLSRVVLRERCAALVGAGEPALTLIDGSALRGRLAAVGADWVAVQPSASHAAILVPLVAIADAAVAHEDLLRSARPPAAAARPSLADRMTLGFVLRDLARRRVPVTAQVVPGRALSGTIDRAGADHFDLALHDPGAVRRHDDVTGYRVVAFAAVLWLRLDAPADLGFG